MDINSRGLTFLKRWEISDLYLLVNIYIYIPINTNTYTNIYLRLIKVLCMHVASLNPNRSVMEKKRV